MSRGQIRKEKTSDEGLVTIRFKRCGCRFELLAFRDRLPADLKNTSPDSLDVLNLCYANIIFSNAAKKEPAKAPDVKKAFDGKEQFIDVARIILHQGDVIKGQEDREEVQKVEQHTMESFYKTISNRCVVPPHEEVTRAIHIETSEIAQALKQFKFKLPTTSAAASDADVIRAIALLKTSGEFPTLIRTMARMNIEPESHAVVAKLIADNFLHYAILTQCASTGAEDRSVLVVDTSQQQRLAKLFEEEKIFKSAKKALVEMVVHYPSAAWPFDLTLDVPGGAPASAKNETAATKETNQKKGTAAAAASGKGKSVKQQQQDDEDNAARGLNSLEAELAALAMEKEEGNNKKGGNKKKVAAAPAPTQKAKEKAVVNNSKKEEDEEEEITSKKKSKQRGKGRGHAHSSSDDDE